jgi:capsular polysaccharide biosynthesis protein
MNEQPLNLRASLQEIWRRRLLVTVVAVLCGLGGVILGFLEPVDQTAIALVLLPPSAASTSGASANSTRTDAIIAESSPVLAAAGAKLSPPLGATDLKNLVAITALSGQVLQIHARAPRSTSAKQLANAVASSYVKYSDQLETSIAGPGVTALHQESALLTRQIRDLETQINVVSARIAHEAAGSSAGEQDASLLGALENEQNQVSIQLGNVTNQISTAQLASGSGANTTLILQNAVSQPVSQFGFRLTAGLVGFAAGLLGSAVFVLVRLQRDRRLRLRDEIARVVGAPVIASLDARGCANPSAWRKLLESRPPATAEWALRHVLHTLLNGGAQRRAVRVISFAGDSPALTTGPRLALHAAASGTPTRLIPEDHRVPEDRSLVSLRAAFTGAEPVGRGMPLTVGLNDVGEYPLQLPISIVVFDGKLPTLAWSDTTNLLSISANFVTADELAELALEIADRGSVLDGVVVVNPDPTDNTSGLIAHDTLRLLPFGAHAVGGDGQPVLLRARTRKETGSPERLWSREH